MHLSGLFLCADKPQRPKGLHALPTTVSSSGCCSAGVPVTLAQRKAFEVQKWCRKNNTLSFFSFFLLLTHFGLCFFFLLFPNKTDAPGNKSNKCTRRLVGGDHDSFRGFVFCLELKALHIYKPSNFQSRDSSSSILIFANPFLCLFFFFLLFEIAKWKQKLLYVGEDKGLWVAVQGGDSSKYQAI